MADEATPEIERVIDELRLLWNALVRHGEALHDREALTMGMRAILEFLLRHGPTPVPGIARARGVSRQHVQSLVNPLLERRLVRADENPAHRRSSLIGLTPKGERTIRRMRAREARLLEARDAGLTGAELAATADALRRIRLALDDPGAGVR